MISAACEPTRKTIRVLSGFGVAQETGAPPELAIRPDLELDSINQRDEDDLNGLSGSAQHTDELASIFDDADAWRNVRTSSGHDRH